MKGAIGIIGIVVIAHGGLAKSLEDTANLFIQNPDAFTSLDLLPESGTESFMEKLQETIKEVDRGEGVLVLIDLFGGTPANSLWKVISLTDNCLGVTGVNLGMVLEVLNKREYTSSLMDLMNDAKESGTKGIQGLQPFSENSKCC